MPPGRSSGGSRPRGSGGGGGSGRGARGGRSRGGIRGGRGRGHGGGRGRAAAGRGTALPSSFASKAAGSGKQQAGRNGRRGKTGDASYEFEDKAGKVDDRYKYDDEAGDSDTGADPEDSDFEDEEVDEDEAFNSADEDRYGDLMETILERTTNKQGDEDEEDDDSGDDDDDDDGGMSFMDMINANEAKVSAPGAVEGGSGGGVEKSAKAAVKGKGNEKMLKKLKGSGRGGSTGTPGDETRTSPPSADASSGSEEEFSEKAEESSGDDDNEDPMDFVSSDDSEDDDDDEDQRHAKLLGFVGALGEKTAASDRAAEDRRASQLLQEGEFNATTAGGGGSAAHSGVSRNGGITMEALMGSLQDTKGFAAVKRQVAAFSGKAGAPSAPTSKAAELRAEREAAYDSRKGDMGKWVAPVQANRQAETIDFTTSVKANLSNASMASKMEATTDLEREVEMLLTAGGASEANLAEREKEELQAKAFTLEEVKERQSELSKMRALMFYQERKQHHMNKIKSKVYRKIKKRQRDRATETELEANGEMEEVKAKKRAEERMSLRHKNTTKWVKNALRARGGAGADDRKAISEQLRLGQELRAKMDGVDRDNDSESDDSSEDGDGSPLTNEDKKKAALRQADREALLEIGEEGGCEGDDESPTKGKGSSLLKMAFMQKAMDKQRKRAKEEATTLLKELEAASHAAALEEEGESGSDQDNIGRKSHEGSGRKVKSRAVKSPAKGDPSTRVSKVNEAKATAEIARALPPGALQTSAVAMDPTAKSSVSAPITINLGGADVATENGDSEGDRDGVGEIGAGGGGDGQISSEEEEEGEGGDDHNPWLAPAPKRSRERRRAAETAGKDGGVVLDVRKAAATALSVFSVPSNGAPADVDGGGGNGGGDDSSGGGSLRELGGAQVAKRDHMAAASSSSSGGKKKKRQGEEVGNDQESGKAKRKRARKEAATNDQGSDGGGKTGEGGENAPKAKAGAGGNGAAAKNNGGGGGSGASGDGGQEGDGTRSKKKHRGANRKKQEVPSKTLPAATAKAPTQQLGLGKLSNDELVRRAFATPDFETEFKDFKEDEVNASVSKGREKLPGDVAGWGSWAGEGAPAPSLAFIKRRREVEAAQAEKEDKLKKARKDDRLPRVMINDKRQKRSAKYMVAEVPYPFTSREQYERSLRQPIGGEWNTSQSVRAMTRPAVIVRAGAAVAPMKLGKLHRENAKEKEALGVTGKKGGFRGGPKGKGGAGAGRKGR